MIDIDSILIKTEAFINTMYAVHDDFGLCDDPRHLATCINRVDLQEMRDTFIEELTNTIVAFVYSPTKQQEIKNKLLKDGRDESNAWTHLVKRARKKFRPSDLRGQFSELLLCNLLQHYYKAAPLLRKMPITTNPSLERNGSDAIHLGIHEGKYRLYLGEAKTYKRESQGLKAALKDAVVDLVQVHYKNHRSELALYTFEDFIPLDLEEIAQDYLSGKSTNVEMHLVCIVTYDEQETASGSTREEKLDSTIATVKKHMAALRGSKFLKDIPSELLPRLNYVIFPVHEMDNLIEAFSKELSP